MKRRATMSPSVSDDEKEQEEKEEEAKEEEAKEEVESSSSSSPDTTVYIDSDDEEYTASAIDAMPSGENSLSSSTMFGSSVSAHEALAVLLSAVPADVFQAFNFMEDVQVQHRQTWSSTGEHENFRLVVDDDPNINVVNAAFDQPPPLEPPVSETFEVARNMITVGYLPPTGENLMNTVIHPVHVPDLSDLPSRYTNPIYAASTLTALSETMPSRPRWGTLIGSMARSRLNRRRRLFTHEAPSIIMISDLEFDEDEYELATQYFNTMLWEESEDDTDFIEPCENVLNVLLELWHTSGREMFPSFDQLTQALVREISQNTDVPFDLNELYEIVQHYLRDDGSLPHHNDLGHVYEYLLLHNDYPNYDQLLEFNRRTVAFFMNPEQYHSHDKMFVPALHVDKIPRYSNQVEGEVCSICQDYINLGQLALKLPPCNHVFHASNEDCLGEGSILKWLSENNKCPMCKSKVEVALNPK